MLLIVDRVEIVREARGRGIGLHAVARAIRTWSTEDALVVLVASSLEEQRDDERGSGERLMRHWSRLGLKRHGSESPPVLLGHRWLRGEVNVEALCEWPPLSAP